MGRNRSFPRTRFGGTQGVALVEFAFVAPILITLLIGTFWIGRAVSVHQALERAAREGARLGITPHCASCSGSPADDTAIRAAVVSVLADASLDTINTIPVTVIDHDQQLDSGVPANYQSSAVRVTVSYPVQLKIPFTSQKATSITLSSSVSMRQEY